MTNVHGNQTRNVGFTVNQPLAQTGETSLFSIDKSLDLYHNTEESSFFESKTKIFSMKTSREECQYYLKNLNGLLNRFSDKVRQIIDKKDKGEFAEMRDLYDEAHDLLNRLAATLENLIDCRNNGHLTNDEIYVVGAIADVIKGLVNAGQIDIPDDLLPAIRAKDPRRYNAAMKEFADIIAGTRDASGKMAEGVKALALLMWTLMTSDPAHSY